jgi:hypothetical protein
MNCCKDNNDPIHCQNCDEVKTKDEMEDDTLCSDCYMDFIDHEPEYTLGDQIVRK